MKLLDDYFKLQKQIYEYFKYVENWVVIPLDDGTDYFWYLDSEISPNSVRFADTEADLFDDKNGNYYENQIYTQRFLTKFVYRTEDYTMICVDTNTDGNKFLQVFDNLKERNPDNFINKDEMYIGSWE
jgi:hypothetical protein